MKKLSMNQQAFFALLKAGLWEQDDLRLSQFNDIDFSAIYDLAEKQTVIGLVTTGIEHINDVTVPSAVVNKFVGKSMKVEKGNKAMNEFLEWFVERLRERDVHAILVTGQGIAQCYEKPLWRVSGDIDLLLDDTDYEKAKVMLTPLSVDVEKENKIIKHIGMTMQGGLVVELHGTLHSRLSRRVERVNDEVQRDVFDGGKVRSWKNGGTTVLLPSPDNDVIYVFTHILHHYYIGGIGLRQICDWCRLLWTYRESLDLSLLESRIRRAGLMSEWKVFAALAVDWLGMPAEAMPLYSPDKKWSRKAKSVVGFVLKCGNFGHNRKAQDSGKVRSAWSKTIDFANHACVFPLDSLKFYFHFLIDGIVLAFDK